MGADKVKMRGSESAMGGELEKNKQRQHAALCQGMPPTEEETSAEIWKMQRNQPATKRIQNIELEGTVHAKVPASGRSLESF